MIPCLQEQPDSVVGEGEQDTPSWFLREETDAMDDSAKVAANHRRHGEQLDLQQTC